MPQVPQAPGTCYTHAAAAYESELAFKNSSELDAVLHEYFEEVVDGSLQEGDVVRRTGHVGIATGEKDTIAQFGYPEHLLGDVNRRDALLDKKQRGPLTSAEEDELLRLNSFFDKWHNEQPFVDNEVPLGELSKNRNDDYRTYRPKPEHRDKLRPNWRTGGGSWFRP